MYLLAAAAGAVLKSAKRTARFGFGFEPSQTLDVVSEPDFTVLDLVCDRYSVSTALFPGVLRSVTLNQSLIRWKVDGGGEVVSFRRQSYLTDVGAVAWLRE
jgi:hypothetical protein